MVEWPDVASSSEVYAQRFYGAVGEFFLTRQLTALRRGLTEIGTRPGCTILDVGGGHAQAAIPLIQAGYQVTVVGSDPRCAARLEQSGVKQPYRFVTSHLLSLPWNDRSFDVVISLRMLAHVAPWREYLAELCRVARRGVIVDFADQRGFNSLAKWTFAWKKRIEGSTRRYRCHSTTEIAATFASQGFSNVGWHRQFWIPMAIHRAVGRARFSQVTESLGVACGLTQRVGSPVLAVATHDAADSECDVSASRMEYRPVRQPSMGR